MGKRVWPFRSLSKQKLDLAKMQRDIDLHVRSFESKLQTIQGQYNVLLSEIQLIKRHLGVIDPMPGITVTRPNYWLEGDPELRTGYSGGTG